MPTYRDQAIVLNIKPVRDADRHYVLFTRRHGKIKLLAAGTRRGKSKMSPHLGSHGVAEIMAARGRIMDRLAGASLKQSFPEIATDLTKLLAAQSFLLTVDKLTRTELPDEHVFELLVEFLATLNGARASTDGWHQLLTAASFKLLDGLGFGLELEACVGCRETLQPEGNGLNLHRGGIECPRCRVVETPDLSAAAVKAFRFWRRAPLTDAIRLRMTEDVVREVDWIAELLMTSHFEERLPAMTVMRAVA